MNRGRFDRLSDRNRQVTEPVEVTNNKRTTSVTELVEVTYYNNKNDNSRIIFPNKEKSLDAMRRT